MFLQANSSTGHSPGQSSGIIPFWLSCQTLKKFIQYVQKVHSYKEVGQSNDIIPFWLSCQNTKEVYTICTKGTFMQGSYQLKTRRLFMFNKRSFFQANMVLGRVPCTPTKLFYRLAESPKFKSGWRPLKIGMVAWNTIPIPNNSVSKLGGKASNNGMVPWKYNTDTK